MASHVRKAVFPVAGLGTRFLPATKSIPKELLPVVDKPVIQHAVDEARAAGIEQFVFVTSRGKSAMEDHFDRAPELEETLRARGKHDALETLEKTLVPEGDMTFVRQPQPLGLGHAIWCARHIIGDEPFAVLLPDEVFLGQSCIGQLIEAHAEKGRAHVLAVLDVPEADTPKYGILKPESDPSARVVRASAMVEKPPLGTAPSTLAAVGRYVLDPVVFEHLNRKMLGAGNEIQLTDAIAGTMDTAPLYGCRTDAARFDCGDRLGFLKANISSAMMRPELQDGLRDFMREVVGEG